MAERVNLTREEVEALQRLRAEFERTNRRAAEETQTGDIPAALIEETRPHRVLSLPGPAS